MEQDMQNEIEELLRSGSITEDEAAFLRGNIRWYS